MSIHYFIAAEATPLLKTDPSTCFHVCEKGFLLQRFNLCSWMCEWPVPRRDKLFKWFRDFDFSNLFRHV